MNRKRYIVGIDPGGSTGYAVYDRLARRIVEMGTVGFWDAYEMAAAMPVADTLLVIETPKKTRLYQKRDQVSGARYREKIAANVGSNAREAELLCEGLARLGFEVRRVVPTAAKWDAAKLEMITGIGGRTSQHVRDAVQLCYGV